MRQDEDDAHQLGIPHLVIASMTAKFQIKHGSWVPALLVIGLHSLTSCVRMQHLPTGRIGLTLDDMRSIAANQELVSDQLT